ncbi:MAG: M61 family metallopeptidase, partial [Gluconacetobacter diazotrophicus]|nr:M61 family metallopeptidase [Gluconacetobacter diazotrophicus]
TLAIDATDLQHHIFSGRETVPLPPGAAGHDFVLLFPQWLPGHHSTGDGLDKFGSLVIQAGSQRVPWTRDPVNVYAFHVPVPAGADSLSLSFQFFSPVARDEGRVAMTPSLLSLQWNDLLLYPAGWFSRDLMVDASATLPAGWSFGSGLDVSGTSGATTTFKRVPLNTLVDNPLLAGRFFRRIDLTPPAGTPGSAAPVHLDLAADDPDDLSATPAQIADHRALVEQAGRLFGSHHYDHYDFLLSLSDELGGIGLEHHRSSENGTGPGYFTDWAGYLSERDLLPHEYTHSWNGKYRRPADLWQPNFNEPERDTLLWVYEGQTQYWGKVLASRSGLWSSGDFLDALAFTAAEYSTGVGRTWRTLVDTTNDPIIASRRPIPWRSWQRSEDYYEEGALVWLDADTLIRERTGGKKSLDDFARTFFGSNDGSYGVSTYTFDDVAAALNAVTPYDWAGFLRTRLFATGPVAPLDGITRGGYRLEFDDTQSPYLKSREKLRHVTDLTFSIGVALGKDGVRSVAWDSPAFKAGMVVGDRIVAVNGREYDADALKRAITDNRDGHHPITLLVQSGKSFREVRLDWTGGLRYPHLRRAGSTPAFLDTIAAARH